MFVPVFHPGMPCASWPSLLTYKCDHTASVLGFVIRWQYSRSSPLAPFTKLAISQNDMENLHCNSWDGEILQVELVMLMHDNIASCIMLWDLVVRLLGVGLLSLSWEM